MKRFFSPKLVGHQLVHFLICKSSEGFVPLKNHQDQNQTCWGLKFDTQPGGFRGRHTPPDLRSHQSICWGFDKARQQLMKVGFDPRPVMSSVYALYRGDDDAKFIDALVARGTHVVKVFFLILICSTLTLPKTNKAFLKIGRNPKGKFIFQPSIFSGKLLVSGRVFLWVEKKVDVICSRFFLQHGWAVFDWKVKHCEQKSQLLVFFKCVFNAQ